MVLNTSYRPGGTAAAEIIVNCTLLLLVQETDGLVELDFLVVAVGPRVKADLELRSVCFFFFLGIKTSRNP